MYIKIEGGKWVSGISVDVFEKVLNEVEVPFKKGGGEFIIPHIKGNKYTETSFWVEIQRLFFNLGDIAHRNGFKISLLHFANKDIKENLKKEIKELCVKYPFKYDIGTDVPIKPSDNLPFADIPYVNGSKLVIVGGRAPIWWYGFALNLLSGMGIVDTVAFFDPRVGAVVVYTTNYFFEVGEVLDIEW